jgi:hypothetical protein
MRLLIIGLLLTVFVTVPIMVFACLVAEAEDEERKE